MEVLYVAPFEVGVRQESLSVRAVEMAFRGVCPVMLCEAMVGRKLTLTRAKRESATFQKARLPLHLLHATKEEREDARGYCYSVSMFSAVVMKDLSKRSHVRDQVSFEQTMQQIGARRPFLRNEVVSRETMI